MSERFKYPNQRYGWLLNEVLTHNYEVGAEIGCRTGGTSGVLLKHAPKLVLYCVDLWKHVPEVMTDVPRVPYEEWNFAAVKRKFDISIRKYRDRARVLQGISWDMADHVEDNSLDFIFIDADHGYTSVKKDIHAWAPKLKPGGLLSGHDINLPGVRRAVEELLPDYTKAGVANIWFCKKEDYGV